ncbi:dethiobiotin synthase [bacterium Unc6]|nr:dethiobiotin synthase [bacterium Unc6]
MHVIFIAGTDTSVGKSVVTGLLAKFLLEKGYSVVTQKWVQTGSSSAEDINTHLKFLTSDKYSNTYHRYKNLMCPYVFKFPASPHLAARMENKTVSISKIQTYFYKLKSIFDFIIVEGTGGLMVPLNCNYLSIDLIKKFNIPVVLVVGNKLGCINHSLLSIHQIHFKKINFIGCIFNNFIKENRIIQKDNPNIIKKISKTEILGILPYKKNIGHLQNIFKPIGEKIKRQCVIEPVNIISKHLGTKIQNTSSK